MNRDFIVLGYYEKMKQMYLGKSFVYDNFFTYGMADGADNNKCNNLIDYETNLIGDSIPKESIWKCVEISAYSVSLHNYWRSALDSRCPIILIFENDKLGKTILTPKLATKQMCKDSWGRTRVYKPNFHTIWKSRAMGLYNYILLL